MTDKEMLDCLQYVWENMTMDRDRTAYSEMLVLLENMFYFLRDDLQIDYPPHDTEEIEVMAGTFEF